MDLGSHVRSAFRWSAAGRVIAQLFSWIATLFVIRALSPADYGLMGMAMIVIGLAALVREIGFGSALIQATEVGEDTLRKVFTFLLLLNGALYALAFYSAPIVSAFFAEPLITPIIQVLALQFPIMSFEVIPQALLAREMRFKARSLIVLGGNLVNAATTLGFALTGFGVWALVFGQLCGAIARIIGCMAVSPIQYGLTRRFSGIGALVSFGTAFTGSRIVTFLNSKAPHVIIGRILGKETLGLYSVASELATMPYQKLLGVLNPISLAAFSRIKHDGDEVARKYLYSTSVASFVTFPLFFGLAATASYTVPVILGDQWLAVAFPLAVIAISSPIRMLYELSLPMLFATGAKWTALRNQIMRLLVAPPVLLVATDWGLEGVVVASLAVHAILFLYTQDKVLRTLEVSRIRFLDAMGRPFLVSAAMAGGVLAVTPILKGYFEPEGVILALQILVGIVLYGTLSIVLNRQSWYRTLDMLRR